MPARPNILLITCHDLGDYLGCYGTPVATPHLDSLAAEGVLLQNHFSTDPVCSPSRGSLMTGCYPHTHGLMGLVPRGWALETQRCPALPELLAQAGYQTHLFGLQHEHWDPQLLGYQVVHPIRPPYFCDEVTPVVTQWLEERQAEGPFFANVGFFDPHRIGLASQGYRQDLLGQVPSHFKRPLYPPVAPGSVAVRPYLADTAAQRAELADFYGAVMTVDRMVGRILQAVDRAGLRQDTLVIFVTDHGASFLHSKGTLYDGGLKVACMLRWPGVLPAGKAVPALTSHVDLLPTLLAWLELPAPAHLQGNSLARLLQGQDSPGNAFVFAEKNYTQYFDPARMVRSEGYKYIRKGLRTCIFDFVLTEIELSPASFRNNPEIFDFYPARRGTEELYDLRQDPAELHNLIEDPAYQDTLAELRAELERHLQATDDPFRSLHNELWMPEEAYRAVKKHGL